MSDTPNSYGARASNSSQGKDIYVQSLWKWLWVILCIVFWPLALAVIIVAMVMFVAGGDV